MSGIRDHDISRAGITTTAVVENSQPDIRHRRWTCALDLDYRRKEVVQLSSSQRSGTSEVAGR